MTDIRLEIKINGETMTTAGVAKDSVLMQHLCNVPGHQSPDATEPPSFDFHVSGNEIKEGDIHASLLWIYRQLTIGDEITIRILGPGQSDPPIRYVSDTVIEDPLLGRLVSGPGLRGCWNTQVNVSETPYKLQLQIPGAHNGISPESRDFCTKIIQSLNQLIAESLSRLSEMLPDHPPVENLLALLIPRIGVDIEPTKTHKPIAFTLKLDFPKVTLDKDDSTGFFFDFHDWQIQEINQVF